MKPKYRDIIAEKSAKLQELDAQAASAVDLVQRTISGLELVNEEIDDTIAEIDAQTAQMMETRKSLDKGRRKNAAVIKNFNKLLSVEEDEEVPVSA